MGTPKDQGATGTRATGGPDVVAENGANGQPIPAPRVPARHVLDTWLFPTLIHAVAMCAQLVIVVAMRRPDQTLWSRLSIWDGQRYAAVAAYGYPHHIQVALDGSLVEGHEYAFFPLYPMLVSFLSRLTTLDVLTVGILVSSLASVALGPLTYRLATEYGCTRNGVYVAVGLLGALPMAVVFEMGYADALFTALAFAALLFALRERWGTAAALLAFTCLTRPVGYVVATAILALVFARRTGDPTPRRTLKIVACAAAGFAATLAFWVFAAVRTGDPTAYFDVQKAGWNTTVDYGASTRHFLAAALTHPGDSGGRIAILCALITLGYAVVSLVCLSRWRAAVFAVVGVVGTLSVLMTTNYWHSKPRLLLVCAVLVVPAGEWLSRCRPVVAWTFVVVASAAAMLFSAYMVTRWPYAI